MSNLLFFKDILRLELKYFKKTIFLTCSNYFSLNDCFCFIFILNTFGIKY